MKKLMILALSAVMAVSVSAQDKRHDHARREKPGKEMRLTREERVEHDIKHFTRELFLSDKQAENFAKTYREYCAKADELLPKKCKELNNGEKQEKRKELSDKELDKLFKERLARRKEFIKLQETYYDKFRKDLNPRQVEKVLRFKDAKPRKPRNPEKKH